jgi:uncharacterized protein YdaU (DUF1376 family)
MNFYPFHIGDYISHTNHLNDAEDLAYRRMIDLYYQSEQPFYDSLTVARRIRATVEVVEVILHEFFTFEDDDGAWHNKRIDEEIAKYHDRLTQASKAGKASAEARFNKRSTSVQPTKNQEPITKNHKPNIDTPDGVDDSIWKDFKKLREKQKAVITETAIKGLKREALKANMTLEQVIQMCCERGWRSFKAEWAESAKAQIQANNELPLGTDKQIEHAYKVECGGDPSKANFRSYQDMRKFIQDFRDKSKRALQ